MARVMVVDDAVFMRMTIRKMIELEGYEVVGEAGNGVEAVQKYMEAQPDVVMLDITMPEMNGIDALKRIKEFDPKAKVIMCSAMGQQAMVVIRYFILVIKYRRLSPIYIASRRSVAKRQCFAERTAVRHLSCSAFRYSSKVSICETKKGGMEAATYSRRNILW